MNIVEVQGLSKAFGENRVLDKIDFTIQKGTFTALLGKNGSGKSTILNILMGHELYDEGACFIMGEDLKSNPVNLKNRIGHVSEKIRLDYPMSMTEFIPQYGKFFENFDLGYFKKIAKEANIDLNKQFGEYSRGQKMQVVLMAALAQSPELLLIDEITSVLDAYARTYFISVLKEYTSRGGTVVLTTNIVNEIQFICSDVLFLSKGHIKFQSPIQDIKSNFRKIRTFNKMHPFLGQHESIWCGVNSDGSHSYIVPGTAASVLPEGILEDRRIVSLEDLYIYHSQSVQHD